MQVFFERAVASIIDIFVFSIMLLLVGGVIDFITALISMFVSADIHNEFKSNNLNYNLAILALEIVVFINIYVAYFWAFLSSKWRATPGKRIMGIYVMDANNQPLSFFKTFVREFVGKLLLNKLIFMIGYIMVGLRKDNRGLHDLIANTYVYKGKAENHPSK